MKRITAFIVTLSLMALTVFSPHAAYAMSNAQRSIMQKKGVVLVLSGGGTKGLSHLGVFEVLERERIPVAAIVGTSMGAIMGGLYACGYSPDEMKAVLKESDLMEIISGRRASKPLGNVEYTRPPVPDSALLRMNMDEEGNLSGAKGLLKAKDLYSFLTELTGRASVTDFNQLPIPFAAIATDLESGEVVVLRDGNLASALRASMSIPIVFEPWEIDGRLLVDGGLKANLPVMEAKKIFPGHPIVAVNLSSENIQRPRASMRSMIDVAEQTLEILMVDQIRDNAAEADIVIEPEVSSFGVLDSSGYDKIIDLGVKAAEERIGDLRTMMAGFPFAGKAPITSQPVWNAPIVAEVEFEGMPESIARDMRDDYRDWIGKPLDAVRLSEVVKDLSDRPEYVSVQGRTRDLPDNRVAIIFYVERPPKYEFGVDMYTGNIHPDRWISLNAQVRDILHYGDCAAAEVRVGSDWGAMVRYFSATDRRDSQWGVMLVARNETVTPLGMAEQDFNRFAGRAAWYRDVGNMRFGIGYMADYTNYGDKDVLSGPYASFEMNTTDDPILPTRGTEIMTELWYPFNETLMSNTRFKVYMPFWERSRLVLSGGLKTGDADKLPYAAMLGTQEELFSLASNPLVGDQAWWVHLGVGRNLIKSWWGGINFEIFARYGETMISWSSRDKWWELGVGLDLPTNNGSGRLIFVYDKDGGFTVGYSIGIPRFWEGPLP